MENEVKFVKTYKFNLAETMATLILEPHYANITNKAKTKDQNT